MPSQDTTTPSPPSAGEPNNTSPPLPERNPILHGAAIAIAILGPVALILPSRGGAAKSTLQNAALGGASFWGFNQLAHDYTGKSITARSSERWGALLGFGQGKEAASAETAASGKNNAASGGSSSSSSSSSSLFSGGGGLPTERAERNRALMAEEKRRRRAEAEGREYKPGGGGDEVEGEGKGVLGRLWMGGEKEGWRERRLEEERRALDSGRGYGGLIADQIREVFGRGEGKKKGGDGGEGKE